MHRTTVFLSAFAAAVFLAATVKAEVTVEEIVVTSMRMEEPIGEATQDITVITKEEIEKSGADFLPEVLRPLTDIHIVQNGGVGKQVSFFIRGGSANRTVVMIDGVRVKSTTSGSFDISRLSVDDMERIEIVKGPHSTLYGSDAMAGVINIITKKGVGRPKINGSFEAGSFDTANGYISLGGNSGILDYRLSASYFETDGISVFKDGPEEDGYRAKSASAKLGATPSEKIYLELNLRHSQDSSDLDDYGADNPNFTQDGVRRLLSGRGSFYISENYTQTLVLSSSSDDLRFRDPVAAWNNSDIDTSIEAADWQHDFRLKSGSIIAGAEYRKESGENQGRFDEEVINRALYLNAKCKHLDGSLILNAGLRYDDHETAGSETTYRLGALYDVKDRGLRLRVAHATGFRAPTLNDLFYPGFSNPALKPEESKSYEAGVEKDLLSGRLLVTAAYFLQRYHDMIALDAGMPQNIKDAEIKGLDVGASFRATENILLRASHTNMDATDEDADKPLTWRPKNKFNASIEYTDGPFSIGASTVYVSTRRDVDGSDVASYAVANLNGSYAMTDGLTLFARVDNLFDEDYEEAGGYGTAGASVFAGVRAGF